MTRPPIESVIGISPCGLPDVALAVALGRAGALGVVDIGPDRAQAGRVLEAMRGLDTTVGVLMPPGFGLALPDCVRAVVLPEPAPCAEFDPERRWILTQVCSL